jgi:arabinose-5-phosphate isomerase
MTGPQTPEVSTAIRVLEAEAKAILNLVGRMDETFVAAVEIAASCTGKIAVTGMGKSGIICKKIAATLSSTGSPAIFLHAAEALHGDIGLLGTHDVVLALSKSGETPEILQILNMVKRMGIPVISLCGEPDSTMASYADINLDVSVLEEACPLGLAPTTSTAAALAMGDALAMALMEHKGFRREDFAIVHPAGALGKKLLPASDLMHRGDSIPRVSGSTSMKDVIYEMSRKGLGMTTVTDADGRLEGVISDGDLRRLLEKSPDPLDMIASECMNRNPKTIAPDALATTALSKMEEKRITCIIVVDRNRQVLGVLHIHDLWRTQMF